MEANKMPARQRYASLPTASERYLKEEWVKTASTAVCDVPRQRHRKRQSHQPVVDDQPPNRSVCSDGCICDCTLQRPCNAASSGERGGVAASQTRTHSFPSPFKFRATQTGALPKKPTNTKKFQRFFQKRELDFQLDRREGTVQGGQVSW